MLVNEIMITLNLFLQAIAQRLEKMTIESGWDLQLGEDITALWGDATIRAIHEEKDPLYQIAESAP